MASLDPPRAPAGCQLTLVGWMLLAVLFLLLFQTWRGTQDSPLHDPDAAPRAVQPRGDLAADERSTIELFEANQRSVVHIANVELVQRRDFFSVDVFAVPRGSGSGFVWSEDGYVVTNAHVVEGAARLLVTLWDGAQLEGRVVGGTRDQDLAVLKIDAGRPLRPIVLGSSHDLRVGQRAFALGNPFGLDLTLTTGIVSGLDRVITSVSRNRIPGVIQTDAAINPGNSGGPLLDSSGRLIGINTAIYSPSGSSAGIGFAVPVDTIRRIVPQVIATGRPERAGLGIHIAHDGLAQQLGITGVVVTDVPAGSAAAAAGLRPPERTPRGVEVDVIVAIDGQPVRSQADLYDVLADHAVGDRVRVVVERAGERLEVEVELQPIG